ncbi:hypothetical protein KIH31_09010 [Paenarthrobacter sp. DKR-5]|nr:hypothetical protein [Paenarthrobacter sp. DKR-5]MBT1002743.1 hypothetical protein [Paenarthrobacter sp. DKR-5]
MALFGVAGLLAGGALSFRKQGKPAWTWIAFWVLAAMAVLAAFLLTMPAS